MFCCHYFYLVLFITHNEHFSDSVDENSYYIGVERRVSDLQWVYIDGAYLQFSSWESNPVAANGGRAAVERQSPTAVVWRQEDQTNQLRSICEYTKGKHR